MTSTSFSLDRVGSHASGGRAARPRPTAGFRRVAGAVALVVAPWGFVAANSAYAWATRNGGDDFSGAHALALTEKHASSLEVAVLSAMIGCLLVVPALLAAMRLLRDSAPRLSLFAGASMILGYMCYFGVLTPNFTTLAMAAHGGPMKDYAAVIDASSSYGSAAFMFILFAFGNLIGTLLLAIAVFRSRGVVPAWAAVLIAMWPVLHVTGLIAGSAWFEVTGAVLQAVGFAALAGVVLRTRDEDWDPAVGA